MIPARTRVDASTLPPVCRSPPAGPASLSDPDRDQRLLPRILLPGQVLVRRFSAGAGCAVRRIALELPARSVATTPRRTLTRRPCFSTRRASRSCRRLSFTVSVTPAPPTATRRRSLESGRRNPATSRKPDAAAKPGSLDVASTRTRPRRPIRWRVEPPAATFGPFLSCAQVVGQRSHARAVDRLAVRRDAVGHVGHDGVGAGSAGDLIGDAVAGVEPVVSETSVQHVGAGPAGERVVAVAAADVVRTFAAGEPVGARAAQQREREGDRELRRVLPLPDVDARPPHARRRAEHLDDHAAADLARPARARVDAAVDGGVANARPLRRPARPRASSARSRPATGS